MTRPEGYTQIDLRDIDWSYYNNRSGDKLQGKVVDKVGFCKDDDQYKQMFVIIFTDKTFIAIGINDDSDEEEGHDIYKLTNKWIYNGELYKNSVSCFSSYIDSSTGKLVFDTWVDMLIKLGLWNFTEEECQKIREEHTKAQEKREYAQYLVLKKKFEGKEKA